MTTFDPHYLRIASDALEEAGFADAAEWMRGKIAGQVLAPSTFAGISLEVVVGSLNAIVDLLSRSPTLWAVRPGERTHTDLISSAHAGATLASWIGGQVGTLNAIAALPLATDPPGHAAPWNYLEIPGPRSHERIMAICPHCTSGGLVYSILSRTTDLAARGTVQQMTMNRLTIRLESSSGGQVDIYAGRCGRCGGWFLG